MDQSVNTQEVAGLRAAVNALTNDPALVQSKALMQDIYEMMDALGAYKWTADEARNLPQMLDKVKAQLEEINALRRIEESLRSTQ